MLKLLPLGLYGNRGFPGRETLGTFLPFLLEKGPHNDPIVSSQMQVFLDMDNWPFEHVAMGIEFLEHVALFLKEDMINQTRFFCL